MATHYEILGVDERADLSAIRSAYLERIRCAHPDRSHLGSVIGTTGAADINVAYGVLKDRLRRGQYDRHLAETRYSAVGLRRIEPVPFHAQLMAAIARILLIAFIANLMRALEKRARSAHRTLIAPTLGRSLRLPRLAPRGRLAPVASAYSVSDRVEASGR